MDVFNTGNIREHINTHFSSHTTILPPPFIPPFFFLISLPNHLVLFNNFTDVIQIFLCENKPHITTYVRQDLLQQRILFQVASYCLPDGCILAHDDGGPVSERDSNLLHLFGANIVHIDQEEPGILIKQRL